MSTSTFSALNDLTSNTNFRAWGSALSAALAACGLVQVSTSTGDTGQINWTTVSFAAASTFAGYELWQFNDALQSGAGSNPIVLKIQYGSGANASHGAMCSIQVGNGYAATNNGTLTGNLSAAVTVGTSTATSSASCYISGDGGRIQVMMFVSSTNIAWGWSVSRLVNSSGAVVNTGIELVTIGGSQNTNVSHTFLPSQTIGGIANTYTDFMCSAPPSGTGTYNSNIGCYPLFPPQGFPGNPTMGTFVYFTADISTSGSSITLTMYGSSHTYLCIRSDSGTGTSAGGMLANSNTHAVGLGFRYE